MYIGLKETKYISLFQVFSKPDNVLSVAGGQLQDDQACLVHLYPRAGQYLEQSSLSINICSKNT